VLIGENIRLRPERKSDVDYFVEWYNDFEVMQYLDMYLPATEIEWAKLIEEFSIERAGRETLFVIEVIDGDFFKPIGTVGLHNINSVNSNAMFGIDIGEKDCWNKGYGTKAGQLIIRYGFEQLGLHRI
jgi:RimJ/RimL family protein N-acetyltransferase